MSGPIFATEIEKTLQAIMEKIANGDKKAFETFYDLTRRRIYGIALKILQEPELAEEATLDIYLKIWKQADQYRPEFGMVTVWSNIIARNRALDYLRKRQRRDKVEFPLEHATAVEIQNETPEGLVFQGERAKMLVSAMDGLNEESKKLLLASFFHGMSHGEIAKAFNKPLGTVKTRIRKALEHMRIKLRKLP